MVRQVYLSLRDQFDVLTGKRDKFTPPRRLVQGIGGGDFNVIGREFFRHFVELGQLRPDASVLDVGCGCGRMAVPLTKYLSEKGGYWGFDIVKENIAWCQKTIGPEYRNFHFQLADVFNMTYHPKGKHPAAEYRFPYLDDYFDFVFLTSVFTHMLAPDMRNYLSQIARVLKPGGRCLVSYFLLNDESQACLARGVGNVSLAYREKDCYISDRRHPEAAVGFEERFIREAYAAHGLEILEPIRYGNWCGRAKQLSYQDIIIAVKRGAS